MEDFRMRKIKALPKNTLFINHTAITYQNQHGEIFAVGTINDKFEAAAIVIDLQKLLLLPRDKRVKIWQKLSAELG